MKKTNQTFNTITVLLLAVVLLASSCEKSEESLSCQPMELDVEQLQKSYDDNGNLQSEITTTTTGTYSYLEGRMVEMIMSTETVDCIQEECEKLNETIRMSIQYTENGATGQIYLDGKLSIESEISVVDGKVENVVMMSDEFLTRDYRFIYEGPKVVKFERWEKGEENADFTLEGYSEYTYTDNNITHIADNYEDIFAVGRVLQTNKIEKSHHSFLLNHGLDISNVSNTSFSYDKGINPDKGELINLLSPGAFQYFFNENNVTKLSYYFVTDEGVDVPFYEVNYNYVYNDQKYPVSVDIEISSDLFDDFDQTFNSNMLYDCN
ncbi:MAG: hypothetical protein OCD76_24850 [Reichenbachiella sp.]